MNELTELRQLFSITEDGRQCVFHAQMERAVYKSVANILERLEGKWNKKAQAFSFGYDAKETIENVFSTGIVPKRNPNQFHPTPRQQVMDMIESSDNLKFNLMYGSEKCSPDLPAEQRKIRVLEPSIGRMGIASVIKESYPHVTIIGCEIDEVNAKLAREAGYDVTLGDFLSMPVPASEEDKFDAIVMNPPFQNRNFIKHIRHAQKMLKQNGTLVSIVPSEWMKSASSDVEIEFLDEVTRTSQEITTEYDKDTYESTDTTTRIIELVHPQMYAKLIAAKKDYWIHLNVVEIENDYAFRVQFDGAGRDYKKALLLKELKARRNIHKTPSAVEWADEVMALLIENDDVPAEKTNVVASTLNKTSEQCAVENKGGWNEAVDDLFVELTETFDGIEKALTIAPAKKDTAQNNIAPHETVSVEPLPAISRFAVLF